MDFTQEDTQHLETEIKSNRRYQWLLLLASATGIIGLSVFFVTRSYNESRENIEASELVRLNAIVQSVATQIDGDQYERILGRYNRKDAISSNDQDVDYQEIHQVLAKVHAANNLADDIYTITIPEGENSNLDIAQLVVSSSDNPYFLHSYDDPSGKIRELYQQGGKINTYRSRTDTWVSAFAPIRNSEGKVVGVVEADVKLNEILLTASAEFRNGLIGIVSFTVAMLLAVITLTVFVSRSILKAQNSIVDAFSRINFTFNLLSDFASQIGKGNFDNDLTEIEGQDNNLAHALLKMRENLLTSKEADEKRSWTIRGVAKFGEELRNQNNDLNELSRSMISGLVKYLGASQGAIYILDDEDPENQFLELRSTYAFDREKHISSRVEIGNGLVGQCWQERKQIFLTEVPQSYINITSGLGGANPTCIILVPLMVNDDLFGVIELATFNVFKDYEVDFIGRVADSIGSTISVVKVNERTSRLLGEAQSMTEEMQGQEEQLRQNAEEMRATQEEMNRTINGLQQQLSESNETGSR